MRIVSQIAKSIDIIDKNVHLFEVVTDGTALPQRLLPQLEIA